MLVVAGLECHHTHCLLRPELPSYCINRVECDQTPCQNDSWDSFCCTCDKSWPRSDLLITSLVTDLSKTQCEWDQNSLCTHIPPAVVCVCWGVEPKQKFVLPYIETWPCAMAESIQAWISWISSYYVSSSATFFFFFLWTIWKHKQNMLWKTEKPSCHHTPETSWKKGLEQYS